MSIETTTTTEAFEAGLRAEFEALARVSEMNVKRNAAGNGYTHLMTQVAWDFYRAATERAAKQVEADSDRLDWIVRQADEFSCAVIVDAPGDGDYIVHGMDGWGQGKTAREAIDNAMQFNGAAAIRASSGKGDCDV